MPTNAAKAIKKSTSGPAGTASQRASKASKITGRKSAAAAARDKTPQKKLPDSQGT